MTGAPPVTGVDLNPVSRLLHDLVHERTGLFFEPERLSSFLEKLQVRLAARSCRSLLDYYYLLRYDDGAKEEWLRVMDAFSVPESYFWRETDQIEALVSHVVPAWFRQHSQPLRIWSAACATGEEPYTIALALQEGGWGSHPIEIVGSDASEMVLQRARRAVFRERSFRALPRALRNKYFTPVSDGDQLAGEIVRRVSFRWANLMDPVAIAELASAPVIFCRNVFIYFSPSAIGQVIAEFARRMPADAHLFVGASESLLKITDAFDLGEIDRALVYRRKPAAP